MTHLTQVAVNPFGKAARHRLASPNRLHDLVQSSIPNAAPHSVAGERLLWRLDARSDGALLYVLSPEQIEAERIAGELSEMIPNAVRSAPYAKLLEGLSAGQQLRFRLKANPTVSKDGRRHAVLDRDGQFRWLRRKGEDHGFDPHRIDGAVDDRGAQFSRRGTTVTVHRVTFDGVLKVTDPAAFADALTTGIGRSKAYGCGLMTVSRV